MKKCPKCERSWPEDCEQSICIEVYSECQVCRFTPKGRGSQAGTADELIGIVDIYEKRSKRGANLGVLNHE